MQYRKTLLFEQHEEDSSWLEKDSKKSLAFEKSVDLKQNSAINLLNMPPSQPLPPKENALFKRILVSSQKFLVKATESLAKQ